MINLKVSDVMTREPVTVPPETNLLNCIKKMVKERVGCLLLVVEKRLVGILCSKDILWALSKKPTSDLEQIKAIDISPRKIATINPNANIEEAFKKMKKLKFEKLPVIHEKEFVGIITAKDILNFHPEFYPELEEYAQIREQSRKLKLIKQTRERKSIYEGVCEECGNTDLLFNVHGTRICQSCKDLMG